MTNNDLTDLITVEQQYKALKNALDQERNTLTLLGSQGEKIQVALDYYSVRSLTTLLEKQEDRLDKLGNRLNRLI
jgi:bacterioferritin (cytochrome b1)